MNKMRTSGTRVTVATIICLLALNGCKKSAERESTAPQTLLVVDVPRGIKNVEPTAVPVSEMNRAVTVMNSRVYVGNEIMSLDDAGERIKRLFSENSAKPIYLQASYDAEYKDALRVLVTMREAGMQTVPLLVRPAGQSELHRLYVRLPEQPDPEAPIKRNPMGLDVEVKSDGKLTLNGKDTSTVSELEKLQGALAEALKTRTTEADKTVSVKGTFISKYDDIVKVIDAAKGAGANTVALVLDDVPAK